MRHSISLLALLGLLAVAGCDDDNSPASDAALHDSAAADTRGTGDGKVTGDSKVTSDQQLGVGDGHVLPWPDRSVTDNPAGKSCTPKAAEMCNGYKTYYCNSSSKCTACPADYTDCDRQGECECHGLCTGTKCNPL